MSNTDKQDRALQPEPPADEIIDDLESIKELLDEEEARLAEESGERPVPLLDDLVDDPVDGGLALEEQDFADTRSTLTDTPNARASERIDDELFDALLGDEWKRSASDLLTQTRGAIEANRNQWTPQDTDELNEALRIRIDATLTAWLRSKIRDHVHELHAELLQAAEATINEQIVELIKKRSAEKTDHDGPQERAEDDGPQERAEDDGPQERAEDDGPQERAGDDGPQDRR